MHQSYLTGAALILIATASVSATAQTAASPPAPAAPAEPVLLNPPLRIPSPGGEVIISTEGEKRQYDEVKFAPIRRAGDFLFLSGRAFGIRPGMPATIENYKSEVRRMFQAIGRLLKASGADFKDVVMIHSYHMATPATAGPGAKLDQFRAFGAVKDEFMPPPHPSWTAVGVVALIPDSALTEADFVAYAPQRR